MPQWVAGKMHFSAQRVIHGPLAGYAVGTHRLAFGPVRPAESLPQCIEDANALDAIIDACPPHQRGAAAQAAMSTVR